MLVIKVENLKNKQSCRKMEKRNQMEEMQINN